MAWSAVRPKSATSEQGRVHLSVQVPVRGQTVFISMLRKPGAGRGVCGAGTRGPLRHEEALALAGAQGRLRAAHHRKAVKEAELRIGPPTTQDRNRHHRKAKEAARGRKGPVRTRPTERPRGNQRSGPHKGAKAAFEERAHRRFLAQVCSVCSVAVLRESAALWLCGFLEAKRWLRNDDFFSDSPNGLSPLNCTPVLTPRDDTDFSSFVL